MEKSKVENNNIFIYFSDMHFKLKKKSIKTE